MDDPTTKFWVKKVIDAAGLQAVTSIPCKPITLWILHKLVTTAWWDVQDYEASLTRAIFSMAFHACARIGEVMCSNGQPQHVILAQNVVIGTGQLEVTFISFKLHGGCPSHQSVARSQRGSMPGQTAVRVSALDQCPKRQIEEPQISSCYG